jgi:hypothetical protein
MIENFTKIFINAIIRWFFFIVIFGCVWFFMTLIAYIVNDLTGITVDDFCCWLLGMITFAFLDSLKGKEQ